MTSHTSCTHPSTSKDRAKCRAASKPGKGYRKADSSEAPGGGYSKKTRAKRETEADATAAEIITKAERKARANAYRTAATQMKNPLKPRGDCYVCGSRAAHAEKKSGEPVCLKHIDDWDSVVILPL